MDHVLLGYRRLSPPILKTVVNAGTWFLYDVAYYSTNVFTPSILVGIFGPSDSLAQVRRWVMGWKAGRTRTLRRLRLSLSRRSRGSRSSRRPWASPGCVRGWGRGGRRDADNGRCRRRALGLQDPYTLHSRLSPCLPSQSFFAILLLRWVPARWLSIWGFVLIAACFGLLGAAFAVYPADGEASNLKFG